MDLELTTLVAPVPVPQQQKEPEQKQEAKPQKVEQNVDVRKELIADVTRTELVPKEVSAKASDVPPVDVASPPCLATRLECRGANAAGPGTGTVVDCAQPRWTLPTNRRHLRSNRLRPALRFPAACLTAKRSAYPNQRIHRLPEQHMLRALSSSRCYRRKRQCGFGTCRVGASAVAGGGCRCCASSEILPNQAFGAAS
jgi:hypothetical protein